MPENGFDDQEREKQIARILAEFEKRLRREYPRKPQTLDEIERTAQKIGEGAKQDIQQEIVDSTGTGNSGQEQQCSCGARRRYKRTSERRVVTLHGEILLRRAYYWCPSCRRGDYPLDRVLALPQGAVSVSVRALVCRFVSLLPYRKAAHELEQICGVHLSVSTLERIAKDTGTALGALWQQRHERVWQGHYEASGKPPERGHISMDGVMAHIGGRWREVKLGVCFEPTQKGPRNEHYWASLSNSAVFGSQLKTLSVVSGMAPCRKQAVLADGSDWIWQEAAKHFTQSTQILDFFHVSEHLWQVAHCRFGTDREGSEEWIGVQKERLLTRSDGATQVLADLASWQPETAGAEAVRRRELAYLQNHRGRMNYLTNKVAGFNIGSGVMESSCRWVVQQRMKGSGMRWQEEGATAVLQLRTSWCSNADADLFEAAKRAAYAA